MTLAPASDARPATRLQPCRAQQVTWWQHELRQMELKINIFIEFDREINQKERRRLSLRVQGCSPFQKVQPRCGVISPPTRNDVTVSEWVGHSVSQWVETYKVFVEISFITLSSRTECCLFLLLFLQLRSTKGGGSEWGVECFFSWFDACVSLWPDSFTLIPYPTPYTPHRRKDRALLSRWTTYR